MKTVPAARVNLSAIGEVMDQFLIGLERPWARFVCRTGFASQGKVWSLRSAERDAGLKITRASLGGRRPQELISLLRRCSINVLRLSRLDLKPLQH